MSGHGGHGLPVRQLAIVTGVGVAMAYLESAAVMYLRNILAITDSAGITSPDPANVWISLPYFKVLRLSALTTVVPDPKLAQIEMWRGAATLVVLVCVAWLAGGNLKIRVGYLLCLFAAWEIGHYVFLRLLFGWPTSLGSYDILFLLPGPSVAPVFVPLLAGIAAAIVGFFVLKTEVH